MEVLVPKTERTKKLLRVGFIVGAFSSPDLTKRAAHAAWDQFLSDMSKQHWTYCDGPVNVVGPRPYVEPKPLPSRTIQSKRAPSDFVTEVPTLEESTQWIYFLEADFWRELPKPEFFITAPGDVPIEYPKEIARRLALGGK